jgi:hypothetical protein
MNFVSAFFAIPSIGISEDKHNKECDVEEYDVVTSDNVDVALAVTDGDNVDTMMAEVLGTIDADVVAGSEGFAVIGVDMAAVVRGEGGSGNCSVCLNMMSLKLGFDARSSSLRLYSRRTEPAGARLRMTGTRYACGAQATAHLPEPYAARTIATRAIRLRKRTRMLRRTTTNACAQSHICFKMHARTQAHNNAPMHARIFAPTNRLTRA